MPTNNEIFTFYAYISYLKTIKQNLIDKLITKRTINHIVNKV